MKSSIFVLRSNRASVSDEDVNHVVSNIGKVKRFVDENFGEHEWAIVI